MRMPSRSMEQPRLKLFAFLLLELFSRILALRCSVLEQKINIIFSSWDSQGNSRLHLQLEHPVQRRFWKKKRGLLIKVSVCHLLIQGTCINVNFATNSYTKHLRLISCDRLRTRDRWGWDLAVKKRILVGHVAAEAYFAARCPMWGHTPGIKILARMHKRHGFDTRFHPIFSKVWMKTFFPAVLQPKL